MSHRHIDPTAVQRAAAAADLSERAVYGPATGVSAEEKAEVAGAMQIEPTAWPRLTETERSTTISAMLTFGGGFVSALAAAWRRADATNAAILGQSFADLLLVYGPGTAPYAAQQRLDSFPPQQGDDRTDEERSAELAADGRRLVRKELAAGILRGDA